MAGTTRQQGPTAYPPFAVPVSAFGGVADAEVGRAELVAWNEVTTGPFRLQTFPGGHFYLHQERASLIDAMMRSLLR